MAKSFAELRASQGNVMDKLKQKVDAAKRGTTRDPVLNDETFYTIKHVRGPDGTGVVKMRFLPAPPDGKGGMEDDPFIKYYEYVFKGPTGKWYNNKSRMTLGSHESDPAYEYNGKIFADETLTKEQKKKKLLPRSEHYVANVLIEKDANAPENEGKVFRFRFGPMIFNIIDETMFPNQELYPDKEGINVFDPFEGASFYLRVTTKEIPDSRTGQLIKVPSYEKSSFGEKSSIVKNPEDFEEIWNRQYSLKELISPDKFKSYEELVKDFKAAMNASFLDTDEPLTAAEPKSNSAKSASKIEDNLSTEETLDDELPWDTLDKKSETVEDTTFSDGDDDWFKNLKG